VRWIPRVWGAALALVSIGATARSAAAQQILQVEGGGNSFTGAYGGRLHLWGPHYEGWIGAGYAGDLRFAGFLKTRWGRDSLRLGFDAYNLALPTDLWAGSPYLVTQGAAWQRSSPRVKVLAFGGVAGVGVSAPFVNASQSEKPLGALRVETTLSPTVSAQTLVVAARRQSLLQSVSWKWPGAYGDAALTAGTGSNRPFAAFVWRLDHEQVEVSAGYTLVDLGFRRADAPLPTASELRRENLLVTVRPFRQTQFTVGRRNFFVASDSTPAVRYALNQASVGAALAGWRLHGGIFDSRSELGHVVSTFSGLGRDLGSRAAADLQFTESHPVGGDPSRMLTLGLREDVRYDLSLSQYLTHSAGTWSGSFGGTLRRGFTNIALSYQTLYVPTRRPDPFVRALTLELRLQLGSYSTSLSTTVDPSGNVSYNTSGGTYLYLGQPALGLGGQPFVIRIQRYIIRGLVVDESGAPIEGAAVDVGGDVVLTNSRGEFFVRVGRRQPRPLRVLLEEFLAAGQFEIVSTPPSVEPADEDAAVPVKIVLRRVVTLPRMPPASGAQVDSLAAPTSPRPPR
jgi:hypothetical protein